MRIRDGGKYLSTDIVVLIATIGISVAGTFFATKSSLESRIEKLEAKLPVTDYLTTRAIAHNINQLSFLRTQIIDLDAQLNRVSIPKLEFAKGAPPEFSGFPGWTPWQLNTEWVTNLTDTTTQVNPLNIANLAKLLDGDAASVVQSEDVFLRLQSFVELASEYNRDLGELVYVFGTPATQVYVPYPTLRRGASRDSAEIFINHAKELLPRMKQSLSGLQTLLDDEIHTARAVIEKNK